MILQIIAGPNGAGKTTIAESLLREIGIDEFVNVDQIARGISMMHPEKAAFAAGKIALIRINQLLKEKHSFAVETTLSSKNILRLIQKARKEGYSVILNFYALLNKDMAIKRVQNRVALGGHNIPVETISRRFDRGLNIFLNNAINEVDSWFFYSNLDNLKLLAYKTDKQVVLDSVFTDFQKMYHE